MVPARPPGEQPRVLGEGRQLTALHQPAGRGDQGEGLRGPQGTCQHAHGQAAHSSPDAGTAWGMEQDTDLCLPEFPFLTAPACGILLGRWCQPHGARGGTEQPSPTTHPALLRRVNPVRAPICMPQVSPACQALRALGPPRTMPHACPRPPTCPPRARPPTFLGPGSACAHLDPELQLRVDGAQQLRALHLPGTLIAQAHELGAHGRGDRP